MLDCLQSPQDCLHRAKYRSGLITFTVGFLLANFAAPAACELRHRCVFEIMAGNKILWADDDYDDLQMMREILVRKKKNYEVVEVHNGKQALEYLKEAKENSNLPCLIILDINMPVLDGKETLSLIKKDKDLSEIPVVVFTTSESDLDRMYCKKFNTEMVTKPPTFDILSSALDKLLQFCK